MLNALILAWKIFEAFFAGAFGSVLLTLFLIVIPLVIFTGDGGPFKTNPDLIWQFAGAGGVGWVMFAWLTDDL